MIEDGDKGIYVRTIDDLVAIIDKNLWMNKQVRIVLDSKMNEYFQMVIKMCNSKNEQYQYDRNKENNVLTNKCLLSK